MKQILFFSPYMPWLPHTLWEATMAYALRQRGHSVRFITCSGLTDCGVAPAARFSRLVDCENCRAYTLHVLPQKMRLSTEFMQTVLTNKEKARIAEWANTLPDEGLRTAEFNGLPLGEWVWPDMLSYWSNVDPDLTRPDVRAALRRYLQGAGEAAISLPRVFDKHNPDILVTLNGSFFLHRVALEIALARGLHAVVHERGWMDNAITFNTDATINAVDNYQRFWREWNALPLTASQLNATHQWLLQRRQGVNMGWAAFSPSHQDLSQVRAQCGLPDKPMALLCTTSDCEGSLAGRNPAMPQLEWVERTVTWFREHPEYILVIRVHPNEKNHAEVDDTALRFYRNLKTGLPTNIRLILPDEKVSTYSLMDLATVGLSYGSTTGVEMACQGIPVVHAGIGVYREAGFTREISDASDLPDIMAHAMTLPRSSAIQRTAYRFVYRIYLQLSVPFPKVKVGKDFITAELNYSSTAELAPGRDAALDRIAEIILGETDLYAPPAPSEQALTQEAEDSFFARLAGPSTHERDGKEEMKGKR